MLTPQQQKDLYRKVEEILNVIGAGYNFKVGANKPASDGSGGREYRMQLVNIQNDTSGELKTNLPTKLMEIENIKDVKFNQLSPNSSKYSSVSFTLESIKFDAVIAKGANNGEKFEKTVVNDLQRYFQNAQVSTDYKTLIDKLIKANPAFGKNEIISVRQRTGSTLKEGVAIENLGAIIGDIILTDSANKQWFISLKDVNGDTFSSYSGAATLIDSTGKLNDSSAGADFLLAFGVNLDQVQKGFDDRKNKKVVRLPYRKANLDTQKTKSIFERAWGMNYFYVRKTSDGWKVFWIDRTVLNNLASAISIERIGYPSMTTKQITIDCKNSFASYKIEIRNSKGDEYPNDIKFKVKSLSLT
jgi:hypothetical protein